MGKGHFHVARVPQLARGRDLGERDSQTGPGHPAEGVGLRRRVRPAGSVESRGGFVTIVGVGGVVVAVEGRVGAVVAGALAVLSGHILSLKESLHSSLSLPHCSETAVLLLRRCGIILRGRNNVLRRPTTQPRERPAMLQCRPI